VSQLVPLTSALAFPAVDMSYEMREHLNDCLWNDIAISTLLWPAGRPETATVNHVYTGVGGSSIATVAMDGMS
jgi:hypothetical protein